MDKHSLVRTVYLYLFALVGLTLLTIGSVGFVNMGLKAFIFTKADEEQRLYNKQPSFAPTSTDKLESLASGSQTTLSELEKQAITQWLTDYKNWQEQNSKIDFVTSQRHRDASYYLAMIIIGLPLFVFHWRIIKKETIKTS
ncbi:MAG: hypothetical protein V1845_02170 [bacterium]